MSDLRTAAQQALDFIRWSQFVPCQSEPFPEPPSTAPQVEAALRAALAEPVQEPVAKVELMMTGGNAGLATRIVEIDDHLRERLRPGQLLYIAPPQRKPLTEEELAELAWQEQLLLVCDGLEELTEIARAIERAHGIGGAA